MPMYVWQRREWPHLTWDNTRLIEPLAECRRSQGRLVATAENLGLDAARKAQAEAITREAVTTAEIEGVHLAPEAVRSSVARRLGLPDAGLCPPDRTVEGLVDILFDASGNHAAALTVERLFGWHAALFPSGYSGLKRIAVATWRPEAPPMQVVSGAMGKEKIHFEAPGGDQVPAEMAEFLFWWKASQGAMDGLLRAGVAHFHFVTIHPFEDGNGRLARALTDMAMAQDEKSPVRLYSLSAQMCKTRKTYYTALEQAQKGTCDITAWLLWFMGCFSQALEGAQAAIATARQAGLFWQKLEGVQLHPRQRKVLGKLLEAEPEGFKGGLTNRKYRSMTRTSQVTAARDLSGLVACGALCRTGAGRSVRYELAL